MSPLTEHREPVPRRASLAPRRLVYDSLFGEESWSFVPNEQAIEVLEPAAPCLVLMLKAPERSKRRLARDIGPLAVEAARRLCACALEDAAAWPGPVCYAPATTADRAWLEAELHPGARLLTQRGANLGARLENVSNRLRRRGHVRQLFIGIDCPQLDQAYLRRAAAALARHDVVLGPAADGGAVLLGTRTGWPPLGDLPWSTDRLYERLLTLCRGHGLRVATLDARADVDDLPDLLAAGRGLERDRRPARRALRAWVDGPLGLEDRP